jgi:organic hydroperoxide reductase OsmC/OhrA
MADHRATIEWSTEVAPTEFLAGRYSRAHAWDFDGGVSVLASSSPSVVSPPWSNPDGVDPEEAFVASIASCHMLTFLYVAAKRGFAVARYRDQALGVMSKGEGGVPWVSRVVLSPEISFGGGRTPTHTELAELHHAAHDGCFIARSVKTEIVVA